jgi:hypothetical protein
MAIHPPPHPDFTCAICLKLIVKRGWGWTPSHPIPPVCNPCAQAWGKCGGGTGDLNPDRRLLRRVWALAHRLQTLAHCIENGHKHA